MPTKVEALKRKPLFSLGNLLITVKALRAIPEADVNAALKRHVRGDWGDIGEEDRSENDKALEIGARLFSAYVSSKKRKFWIITEADRSQTTVVMPEEY